MSFMSYGSEITLNSNFKIYLINNINSFKKNKMSFNRSANNKQLTFKEVSAKTKLPEEEV